MRGAPVQDRYMRERVGHSFVQSRSLLGPLCNILQRIVPIKSVNFSFVRSRKGSCCSAVRAVRLCKTCTRSAHARKCYPRVRTWSFRNDCTGIHMDWLHRIQLDYVQISMLFVSLLSGNIQPFLFLTHLGVAGSGSASSAPW